MAAQERASKKALLAEMDRNERVAHRETLRHQQEQELVVSSASQQSIPGESTSIASSHNNNKKVPSIKKHSSHRRAKKRAIEQQLMMRRSSTFSSADQDDSAMQQIKQEIRAEWDRERAHDSNANVWEQVLEEARIGDDEKPNPNRKKKSAPPKRMLARSISLPASASVLDKESILREMDRNDRVARTTRPKKKHRLDQEQPSQMAEMIMRSGVTLLDEHDAYGAAVDESDDDDDDYDDYDTNTDGSGAPKTQLRRLPNHRAPVLPGVTRHSFRIQTTSSLPGAYGVQDNSLQRFVSGALTPHPFHVATHHHPEDSSVRESVTLSMFDSVDDTTINNSPNKGFISRRGQQFCLYGIVGIIFLLGIGIGLGIGVSTPKSANTSGLRPPKWGDDDSNNNDTDGGEDGINGPDEKDFPIKRIQETCQYDGVQEFHRSFLTDRIVAKRDDFFQQSRIFPNDNDLPSTLSTTSCDARNLAALFAVGNGAEGSSTMNRYVLTLLYLELGGAYWDRSISWLSSTKPNGECEWQGVECASEQVIRLSLGRNGLVGDQLPSEVFSLTSLRELDLNGNEIGGTLSSEVGNLENLELLNLSQNKMTGSLPSALFAIKPLILLTVESNSLKGTLPDVKMDLPNLLLFSCSQNSLTGTIPEQLFTSSPNLQDLLLFENGFGGTIPTEIGDLEWLVEFDIRANFISGSLPTELWTLTHLEKLYLTHWGSSPLDMSVTIPTELGRLTNLQIIEAHSAALHSTIPTEVGRCTNLKSINWSENNLEGTVPIELKNLRSLEYLALLGNPLLEDIPQELCQVLPKTKFSPNPC